MKKILSMAVCAFLFASCTVYQYTGRDAAINRQKIQATPTIVDVRADFTKRVNATSNWQKTLEQAKEECKYLAITTNNIDIVVDPIYQIQVRPHKIRKRYKAVLTGFAGYYINSRTPMEDMNQIKNFTREEIENYLLLHQSEMILPYLYQPQQPTGDVINVHSDHSKNAPKCEKKEAAAPAPEKVTPAPAPAKVQEKASEKAPAPTKEPTSFRKRKK